MNRNGNAPQMQSERTWMESSVHQESCHGVCRHRLSVDGGNEHALMAADAHALLAAGRQEVGQPRSQLGTFGLISGEENEDVRIVASEPGHKLTVE